MKKNNKTIISVLIVLVFAIVIVIHATANDSYNLEDASELARSYKNAFDVEEKISNGESITPVAMLDDLEIYREDIDAQIVENKLTKHQNITEEQAIKEATRKKLIIEAAKKAGFGINESEYDAILESQYEQYKKSHKKPKISQKRPVFQLTM